MSHIAKVNCIIKDLDSLGQAAEKFGGELVRDQRKFKMWGSEKQPCIHAIRLKGDSTAYEIGLRYKEAGNTEEFDLSADFYDGKLTKAFGSELTYLRNEYQALVAEKQLARARMRVRREIDTPQQIRLVAIA